MHALVCGGSAQACASAHKVMGKMRRCAEWKVGCKDGQVGWGACVWGWSIMASVPCKLTPQWGSNSRPMAYETIALTTELREPNKEMLFKKR